MNDLKEALDNLFYVVEKVAYYDLVILQVTARVDPTQLAVPLVTVAILVVVFVAVLMNEVLIQKVVLRIAFEIF